MYPLYAKPETNDLATRIDRIKELLREIEVETAFFSTRAPILYAVPAPSEDCIQIGNVIVCGVSSLTDGQKSAIEDLISSFNQP